MSKSPDRPPILWFLLAFICLIAVALSLAAFSFSSEQAGNANSVFDDSRAGPAANDADRSQLNAMNPGR